MASALQSEPLEPMLLLRGDFGSGGLMELREASDAWDERVRCNVRHTSEKIAVEGVREIVDARIAELAGGAPIQTPVPADVEALVMDRLKPILRRLAALEQTPDAQERPTRFDPLANLPDTPPELDWNLVKRHFRRYGDPRKTAEKYGLNVRELNARARREGWSA